MATPVNKTPRYNCEACSDQGGYEITHHSTDALIGWKKCEVCPKTPPIWKPYPMSAWGTISREVWIDGPADKLKKEEVPF